MATDVNPAVRPGTDFYLYACEGWMARHPLRDDQSANSQFSILADTRQERLREMMADIAATTHPVGSIPQKIAGIYRLVLDQERCNREGIDPIRPLLQRAHAVDSMDAYYEFCAYLCHHSCNPMPFSIGCGADMKQSDRNIVIVHQGGYALLRDFYLNADDNSRHVLTAYQTYICELLTTAGYTAAEASAICRDVIALETRMARVAYPVEKLRDVEANYHKTTWDDLRRRYPHIAWETLRQGIGFPTFTDVVVGQPEPLAEADRLLADTPLPVLRSRLICLIVSHGAGALGQPFRDVIFRFHRTVSGQVEDVPLWRRAVNVVKSTLPDAVGRMYVERYFPEAQRQRVVEMIERLRQAFARRIGMQQWMSDDARRAALDKLAAMRLKVGYLDEGLDDYAGVEVDERLSYFENLWNISAYENDAFIRKTVNQPVDRTEWDMHPYDINACYNLVNNDITFPAGILQPPFFCPDEDDAYNYGAIGTIIGHEMTHGFDDQGHRFDLGGNLAAWWSDDDEQRFAQRAEVLARYFDGREVIPGAAVNGRQTLGESLGDNGGLHIAWDALHDAMALHPLPTRHGFTPEQRFFLAFARNYAGTMRPEAQRNSVRGDVHAPGPLRVNGGVAHIDGWYEAFGITPADPLYLSPEQRVSVW
jgi:putative endopeptidase